MKIVIPNDFTARAYQIPFMRYMDSHAIGGRAVCVYHRRAGKDLMGGHQLCKMAHRRTGVYWHVFPTFEQGRKAIWEGFRSDGKRTIDNIFPREVIKRRNEQQMMVELKCGSIYRIIGSDKIEVVGAGPVGVLFSEYSIAKPRAWDLIAPMLRENGGWAAFVYTPRGNNHGKKLYDMAKANPNWFCDLKTLYDTRAYDPDKTIAEERAAGRPEALIRQEYLCDWTAANVGAVFGDLVEQLEKRNGILDFAHPSDGVFTSWDLGISDATAIWFWRINDKRMPDLIDHYESTGKPLSHYFDVVEAKGYRYVKHWVPHDARAHELSTGVSRVEMFADRWGVENVAVTPSLSIADGLQAARWLLQQPMRIHTRCEDGLEALRMYHYLWDEDRKVFSPKPDHDWSSNTADAFRYLAIVARYTEEITRVTEKPETGPYAVPADRSMTLDALFEARERDLRRWS